MLLSNIKGKGMLLKTIFSNVMPKTFKNVSSNSDLGFYNHYSTILSKTLRAVWHLNVEYIFTKFSNRNILNRKKLLDRAKPRSNLILCIFMKVYFAWLPETLLFYRVRTQLLITMAATRKNKTIFKTFSCYFLFDPFLYLSLRSEELKNNFINLLRFDVFILIWNIQRWGFWLGIIDTNFGYDAFDFPCRYLSPDVLLLHMIYSFWEEKVC